MSSTTADTPAFRDLGLPAPLLQAIDGLGYTHTTEIQALTLPVIAAGRDVAAQAQTGTGKTVAFLLGSFARLLERAPAPERRPDQPRMLVIAPTRELAIQIDKDAQGLARHTGLVTAVVYGGIDYEKQREQLAGGVDVLIGTPGRLIDYFKQKVFDLSALEIVVLDEADRMFDLGFIADIRFLLRRMPPPGRRTSMLFSATLSHRVMELAYDHMNDPEELKTEATEITAKGVAQSLYQPAQDEKIGLLLGLLRDLQPPRSMVFVNTKRTAERIESYLVGNGIVCGLLSGDVRQNKRQRILADFIAGTIPLLIATDVAARGLHIDGVSHVFNYDLPQQAEDYVHRIGRTARAGAAGVAVSFACENYSFSLPEIQTYIGRNIPLVPITDEMLVDPKRPARIERDRVERPGDRRGARNGGARGDERSGTRQKAAPSGAAASRRRTPRPAAANAPTASPTGTAPASESVSASAPAPATTGTVAPVTPADAPKRRRRPRRRPDADGAGPAAPAGQGDRSGPGSPAIPNDPDPGPGPGQTAVGNGNDAAGD